MTKLAYDLDAMKAEFAARGGKAVVVESGARAIESDRTIYAAMREGKRAVADVVRAGDESYAAWEKGVQDAHLARAYGVRD
jgi:hypothetical protein